jgi:hypothetical protein
VAKIANPLRFSEHFSVNPKLLEAAGVLNPTLNVDTRLFIDPMLLADSIHPEIHGDARSTYESHFTTVIGLLGGSQKQDDAPWRSALKLLTFPEIKWTCLGYGAASVAGSGSGHQMRAHLIQTGKEIIALGVKDPDLFVAMALFEEGFGPDLISDMTTNVIFGGLLKFNERILADLSIPRQKMKLQLRNGRSFEAELPVNPCMKGKHPVVLVPLDILRDLPIANDWSDIADNSSKNHELRILVNADIAALWKLKSLKDKSILKNWALSGKEAFETLIKMIHTAPPLSYDAKADPNGELFWLTLADQVAKEEPFEIEKPAQLDLAGVLSVVEQIVEQFRFLIEDRRFSEELYHNDKPRPEKSAQRLFFAVALAYCRANDLDVTPEAETGNGPVDFKVSLGFTGRVLVEIKLSTNSKVVKGYTRQLETYKKAEETQKGYYVVVDVGEMGEKAEALLAAKNEAAAKGEPVSEIIFVDGIRKPSASKL